MAKKTPPFIRLFSNFKITKEKCWEWTGHRNKNGYGAIKIFGKQELPHRFSYSLYNGRLIPGMDIMHVCNNKLCINPDHLKQGTRKENIRSAILDGLIKTGKNSPIYGRKGISGIEKGQSKPVLVLGNVYGSMNEAEKFLCLGSGTVAFWIKKKSKKAKLITRKQYFKMKGTKNVITK